MNQHADQHRIAMVTSDRLTAVTNRRRERCRPSPAHLQAKPATVISGNYQHWLWPNQELPQTIGVKMEEEQCAFSLDERW